MIITFISVSFAHHDSIFLLFVVTGTFIHLCFMIDISAWLYAHSHISKAYKDVMSGVRQVKGAPLILVTCLRCQSGRLLWVLMYFFGNSKASSKTSGWSCLKVPEHGALEVYYYYYYYKHRACNHSLQPPFVWLYIYVRRSPAKQKHIFDL